MTVGVSFVEERERVIREQQDAIRELPTMAFLAYRFIPAALMKLGGGDAEAIWRDAATGQDLYDRLRALPGFGDDKSRIFLSLLAKRLGVRPPGWEEAGAPFSDSTPRSVADIDSPETLALVRDWKRSQKAKGKTKRD